MKKKRQNNMPIHHNTAESNREGTYRSPEIMPNFRACNGMYIPSNKPTYKDTTKRTK